MNARLATTLTLALGSAAAAQARPAPVALIVRSTVEHQVTTVHITSGGTKFGLAVYNGAPGSVTFDGNRGTGTTPTIVTVDVQPGWVRMSVTPNEPPFRVSVLDDTTRKDLVAVGRSIDAVRDSVGNLSLIPSKARP